MIWNFGSAPASEPFESSSKQSTEMSLTQNPPPKPLIATEVLQERPVCFIRNTWQKGWEGWFENKDGIKDHPLYTISEVGWILLRKTPITASVGRTLNTSRALLKIGDEIPTLLEILTGIISYFFVMRTFRKSDQELGIPSYLSRNEAARMLSGKFAWTQDWFHIGEHLVAGLNTPSGIIIDAKPKDKEESFSTVGLVPVRRLGVSAVSDSLE